MAGKLLKGTNVSVRIRNIFVRTLWSLVFMAETSVDVEYERWKPT